MYLTLNLIDALKKRHITARYAHPRLRAFGQLLLGEQGKAYMYCRYAGAGPFVSGMNGVGQAVWGRSELFLELISK